MLIKLFSFSFDIILIRHSKLLHPIFVQIYKESLTTTLLQGSIYFVLKFNITWKEQPRMLPCISWRNATGS